MEEGLKHGIWIAFYGVASVCGVSSTVAEVLRGDILLSSLDAVPAAACIASLVLEAMR